MEESNECYMAGFGEEREGENHVTLLESQKIKDD